MLARHLAVCGVEAEQFVNQADMDHAELRSKVRDYFRAQLEDGKRRIDAGGPLRESQKQSHAASLAMLEDGNREFWHLIGSDNTRDELEAFFTATARAPSIGRRSNWLQQDSRCASSARLTFESWSPSG
ncbi:MAG: hypothetical protein KJO78_14100, partial [Alphaproteobacteria bacterium]|nr:hypothetical protein [Alphaproteobacteria bacterium]